MHQQSLASRLLPQPLEHAKVEHVQHHLCAARAMLAVHGSHDQAADAQHGLQSKLGALSTYDGPHHPEHSQLVEPGNYASIESDCIFLGMAALEDPPRPEVRDAIDECTLAGIRVSAP